MKLCSNIKSSCYVTSLHFPVITYLSYNSMYYAVNSVTSKVDGREFATSCKSWMFPSFCTKYVLFISQDCVSLK